MLCHCLRHVAIVDLSVLPQVLPAHRLSVKQSKRIKVEIILSNFFVNFRVNLKFRVWKKVE